MFPGDSIQQLDGVVDLLMNFDVYAKSQTSVTPLVQAAAAAAPAGGRRRRPPRARPTAGAGAQRRIADADGARTSRAAAASRDTQEQTATAETVP